jgi:hypothetical protein
MIYSKLIVVLAIFGFITSCGDSDTTLTPEEKFYVDSLYNKESAKLKQTYDSLCVINRDTLLKYAIDSVKQVRLKEIEQLMDIKDGE